MPRERHYSPRISRFLVSVLYHEARSRQIPMTTLVDDLLKQSLSGSQAWEKAQELRVGEEPPSYPASKR